MCLARREEDVDLLKAVAQGERVVEPALVRDQDRYRHAVRDLRAPQDLRPVGDLRDHVGTNEARDLEAADAGPGQHLHQPHLVVGGDDLRLVLEAVAGADLADLDGLAVGRLGHP